MRSFRSKPVGWRNESYRHYLAAKGISSKRYGAYKGYPDQKTPEMRELLDEVSKQMFGNSRSESIQKGTCVMCGGPAKEFKTETSAREFGISGMCEGCQEKVFNAPSMEDYEEQDYDESEEFYAKKDVLPGGFGDKAVLSDFDRKEVAMGLKVEMEHTNSKKVAADIVKDHLVEDPKYYTHLKEMEDKYNSKKYYDKFDAEEQDAMLRKMTKEERTAALGNMTEEERFQLLMLPRNRGIFFDTIKKEMGK